MFILLMVIWDIFRLGLLQVTLLWTFCTFVFILPTEAWFTGYMHQLLFYIIPAVWDFSFLTLCLYILISNSITGRCSIFVFLVKGHVSNTENHCFPFKTQKLFEYLLSVVVQRLGKMLWLELWYPELTFPKFNLFLQKSMVLKLLVQPDNHM